MATPKACKSVRNTFLYESMNKSGYTDKIIKLAISKGVKLQPKDLNFEIATINKYYKFPLKKDVLEAYEAGSLKVIVFPPGIKEKISSSIPFMLFSKGNNDIGAYVFIDNYKTYNAKDDTYSIDPKKLYCLLESGYMAILIQRFFPSISRNNSIMSEGADIFAHMFIRVLNRKYALNIDQRAFAKVLYLAAKYYLISILQLNDDEMTSNYALKVSKTGNELAMKEVDDAFASANAYESIYTFIDALKTNAYLISNSLAELTTRDFIVDYVAMYHSSSLFALEHLAYFMFMVSSVITGSYLNNQNVLEEIVGKSGAKMYLRLNEYKI